MACSNRERELGRLCSIGELTQHARQKLGILDAQLSAVAVAGPGEFVGEGSNAIEVCRDGGRAGDIGTRNIGDRHRKTPLRFRRTSPTGAEAFRGQAVRFVVGRRSRISGRRRDKG